MSTIIAKPARPAADNTLFYKDAVESITLDSTDPDSRAAQETKGEKALLCRKCRAAVTAEAHAIEVNGDHFHTFFNPAGIIYEIRCFKQARGCLVHGESTTEFSWFSGHAWQYSLCARCLTHLGWFFTGPAGSFHGLIHNRLL